MKYVAVVVIIIMFVRIDVLLGLFDRASSGFQSPPPESEDFDRAQLSVVVPVSKDKSLQQTPRERFFSLLESFRSNPDPSIRTAAMEIFKSHPTMFTEKLDPTLESLVFRWREHLINNNVETPKFLLELMNVLKGENLLMLQRFWALWMDISMKNFIRNYSSTRDSNCSIGAMFGDPIPEEAKYITLRDRRNALQRLVSEDSAVSPGEKVLASRCLMVIELELSKMNPPEELIEETEPPVDPEETPESSP